MQKPSVGRVVHYVEYHTHRAAIVTEVYHPEEMEVGLAVLSPTGLHFEEHVPHVSGENNIPGTWHYPERVD